MTQEYLARVEFLLLISTLVYFMIIGAQLFETIILVPKWTMVPPESFSFFKGQTGKHLSTFWVVLHLFQDILLAVTLAKSLEIDSITFYIISLAALHIGVRIWSVVYFNRQLKEFEKIANTSTVVAPFASSDLLERTTKWRNLNYLRVGIYLLVSLGVLLVYLHVKGLIA